LAHGERQLRQRGARVEQQSGALRSGDAHEAGARDGGGGAAGVVLHVHRQRRAHGQQQR
jgi:hypothetical protein